ncbi:MAG: DUF4167 domain-containing protein [Holosporales bacterium]|jgi:hypothetical protein|nr:DUF4167 domain-containing protein [Holosporales bacterium]
MKKENVDGVNHFQGLRAKYLNLAKEASSTGDRILYEYNLQFVEHYTRLISEKISQQSSQSSQLRNNGNDNFASSSNSLKDNFQRKKRYLRKKTIKEENQKNLQNDENETVS